MASQLRAAPAIAPSFTPSANGIGGATVVLERLTKRFGEREVLRDLHLEVGAGEFVALIGPSGGGKTTLLRIVAGLEEPSTGTVAIQRPDGSQPAIRVMFQEDRLLPWQSVINNVTFGLPSNERPRARHFLAAVGLADREQDWPRVLSGGQKQRVALARALAHQPDLLLLDEPFGALDALTRAGMQRLLEELWQREQRTVLLVTHDVEEALLLADRVIVLQEGRLVTDLRVSLPRARHRADPWLATHKEALLDHLLLEEAKHL